MARLSVGAIVFSGLILSGAGPASAQSGWDARVPPDRLPPPGFCRIWYDELPPDRQPPAMRCGRAERIAQSVGGRVILRTEDDRARRGVTIGVYDGFNDFRGVPPDRVPPPGFCRAWLDDLPPDRQPPVESCRAAEDTAARIGGRLLYMPDG